MPDALPVRRLTATFTATPPTSQIGLASGVSDVEVDCHTIRCLVYGSPQPFLEAIRGYEVTSLTATDADGVDHSADLRAKVSKHETSDRQIRPPRMMAVTQAIFGSPDVLTVREVAIPKPQPGEVLIRVMAASPNPWDWHFMRGLPYISRVSGVGLRAPKNPILGSDVAGTVEDVGAGVTQFAPGNEVFGFIGAGAFAEYVSAPESRLALRPTTVTFEEAATIPLAGMTALQGIRDAGAVRRGDQVLIIGASGGVGTIAIQIAAQLGAVVTGVCSARNGDLVRSLGATDVIDYATTDPTTTGRTFDVVLQLAGIASPASLRRILTPAGRLILSSGDSSGHLIGPFDRILQALVLSPFVPQTLRPLEMKPNPADLKYLATCIDRGQLRPTVEHTYTLPETADAIRHLETSHVRGKLAISIHTQPDKDQADTYTEGITS